MYGVAGRLDPELLYRLALATYAEMALAGITCVGEFFYLHHPSRGGRYDDPNVMGRVVLDAARDAGIRITLLDTCYLQAGVDGSPLTGVQRRFDDGSVEAWARRLDAVDGPGVRIGAAIHSVRAVPRTGLAQVADYARDRGLPLHAHVSEQPAENRANLETFGLTPVELLDESGASGPFATVVHATHLTDSDIATLGMQQNCMSMRPTTERDLADGVGPAIRLAAAGSPLCVGSDGHSVVDLLEEGRAVELNERLVTGRRGNLSAARIARALTADGAAALGWDTGRIAAGAPADLIAIDLDRCARPARGRETCWPLWCSPRRAEDARTVVVDGRVVVDGGVHLAVPHTGRELAAVIGEIVR